MTTTEYIASNGNGTGCKCGCWRVLAETFNPLRDDPQGRLWEKFLKHNPPFRRYAKEE